jgi:hypothetical protein
MVLLNKQDLLTGRKTPTSRFEIEGFRLSGKAGG